MLTGRRRYRANWRGKLILQVEQKFRFPVGRFGDFEWGFVWRDARVQDLMTIEACHTPHPVENANA